MTNATLGYSTVLDNPMSSHWPPPSHRSTSSVPAVWSVAPSPMLLALGGWRSTRAPGHPLRPPTTPSPQLHGGPASAVLAKRAEWVTKTWWEALVMGDPWCRFDVVEVWWKNDIVFLIASHQIPWGRVGRSLTFGLCAPLFCQLEWQQEVR